MQSDLPRFTPQPPIFERIGGRETVHTIVTDFYARVEADPALRPLFPEDLQAGIERQQLFMEQWLGGAPLFSISRGQPMLRRRHFPFVIGRGHADRWLTHMRAAFEAHVPTELVDEVMSRLEPLAHHMVNEGQDVPRDPLPS
ncbi:MAG: globin [Dehalococcoidia bacterium]